MSFGRRVERTRAGMAKETQPDRERCHIFSFEVLNAILNRTPGRPYNENTKDQINRAMNSDSNLRLKTPSGNRYGNDGYSGDMANDSAIINAIYADDPEEKYLTSNRAVQRLRNSWAAVQRIDLPDELKRQILFHFSQIKNQDGHSIIRANSSY